MSDVFTYELDGNLYVNLTNRCNNDCVFCVRNGREGIADYNLILTCEPSAQEIIAEIGEPKRYKEIVFCGFGEPTYKLGEIKAAAEYVKEKGGKTRLNTNGQANLIHGRDITGELAGLIDVVSISLNASDAEKYIAECRPAAGEAAYPALLDFTALCVKRGIDTVLSVVETVGKEEIKKCRKIAEKLGARLRVRKLI